MSSKHYLLLLLLILILAFSVRIWDIQNNPPGFFVDEATEGYNAYLILKTGKDQWGKSFPVFFRSLDDYKNPVYIYSSIPIIAIFGLNEFSVRLNSVIYGTLSIVAIYLLTKTLFNSKAALFAAFFLAISPWHIHLSRIGFEIISAAFWVTLALYFLQKSLEQQRYFPAALLSLIISFFTYVTPKIYLPILVGGFLLINLAKAKKLLMLRKNIFLIAGAVFLVLFLIYPYVKDGTFFARWNQVKMEEMTIQKIMSGYFNHFSPQFLFIGGEIGFPENTHARTSIHGTGVLYWIQLPLLLLGLIGSLINKSYRNQGLFILLFLLIHPLSSIFTTMVPSVDRSIIGVIPYQIMSGFGAFFLAGVFKNKFTKIAIILIITFTSLISFYGFLDLLSRYKHKSAGYYGWQYGFRRAMTSLNRSSKDYDQLLITHRFNVAEDLLSFYNVNNLCNRCNIMPNPIQINLSKRQLFAIRDEDIKEAKIRYPQYEFKKMNHINSPEGSVALFIGEFTYKIR